MATKKKNHWYVLVCSSEGAMFVTSIDNSNKTAFWNKLERPKEFSESYAKDLALGLMCNGYSAYPVCAPIDGISQPYHYSKGGFEWKWNKKEDNDEKG